MKNSTHPGGTFTRTILQVLFVGCFVAISMLANAQATVTSDKDDYAPLSRAVFTGSGFAANEQLVLKVKNLNQPCHTVAADSSYMPWTVTADALGDFVTNWTVCNCPGDSLRLKVVGQTSGLIAYAYFTDGALTVTPSTACGIGGSATFTLSTGTGGNVDITKPMRLYKGSVTPANLIHTFSSTNNPTYTITNVQLSDAGTYFFTATRTNGNADTGSATFSVNVISNNSIGTNQTICSGNTPNALTGSVASGTSGSVSYRWSSSTNGTTFNDISGSSAAGQNFIPGALSVTTWYRRRATVGSCFIESVPIKVTVNSQPTGVISGSTVLCTSGSATLTILVSGTGPWNGTLSNGTPFSGSNNPISVSVTPSAPTTYTVASLSDANCSGTSFNGSATVTIANPTAELQVVPQGVCLGSDVNVQVDGTSDGIVTYNLNGGANQTISLNNGGNGTIDIQDISSNTVVTLVSVLSGSCSAALNESGTVTVEEVAPVISNTPSNIAVNNDAGICGASVLWTAPTANDNCTLTSFTSTYNSGDIFSLGTTTVLYTAIDNAGNTSTASFTVTVNDTEAPVISCPADIDAYGTSASGAVVNYDQPVASDNCEVASVILIEGSASGSTFPLGTTAVTYEATDASGNTSQCSFTITVTGVPPIISCPADVIVIASSGLCGTTVTFEATETTGIPSSIITYSQASGSFFPVGTTTVTATATNAVGTSSCTFTVTVTDDEDPSFVDFPSNITVDSDAGACGAVVSWTVPTASDNCSGSAALQTGGGGSGSLFPVGVSSIEYTAVDAAGNETPGSFTITVNDTEAPTITASADIDVNNDAGLCSAEVTLAAPTTGDNCGVLSVTNDHSSTTYPVGTTIVTWTVMDIHGNVNTATQNVTVNDNEAPTITAATDVTVSNDAGLCSAVISLASPSTGDNCGVASVSNDAPAAFPVGTTTVTWTVTDIHGNSNSDTQNVTVNDTEAPTITAATDVTVSNDVGLCSAVVTLTTPATGDNCGVANVSNDAPAAFAVGTTTVTWTITDIHGNSSSDTQNVTVNDTEAPTITASADVTVSNDAGLCSAVVSLTAPATGDNCGVASVSNNAPLVFPVGTTIVTWTVTDIHSNSSIDTQVVTVNDTEAPTITASSDVTVSNDAGLCSAVGVLAAPATGDNCGVASVTNNAPAVFPVGTTTVTWTVNDIHGNSSNDTQTVTVVNTAPFITSIAPSNILTQINSAITLNVTYTDNNVTSAVINWDDGAVQTISNPSNSFSVPHTYTVVGVNSITVTLTDACGATATTRYEYVVSYDPTGGFVTGGGWINSPASAYAADLSLTGRANFGFVSKYLKGANVPTGNTEFQFQLGNLNFKSTSYQWLVVSCTKAQYKGVGTINGAGSYNFLITALDGSPDKFRIKITSGSSVVYDNQMGSSEDTNAATEIGGGSIVVHDTRCKNASNARTGEPQSTGEAELVEELSIEAYPNPIQESLSLKLANPMNENVSIQMVDVAGRSVILKNADPTANGIYQINTESLQSGLYILRVKVGTYMKTMKLVKE